MVQIMHFYIQLYLKHTRVSSLYEKSLPIELKELKSHITLYFQQAHVLVSVQEGDYNFQWAQDFKIRTHHYLVL